MQVAANEEGTAPVRSDGPAGAIDHLSAAVACGRSSAPVWGLTCVLVAAGGRRKALLEIVSTAVTCGRITALVEDEVEGWSPSGVAVWPCSVYHGVEALLDHPWARRPV